MRWLLALAVATSTLAPVAPAGATPSAARPAGSWQGAAIEVVPDQAGTPANRRIAQAAGPATAAPTRAPEGIGRAVGRVVTGSSADRTASSRPGGARDPLVEFIGNSFHDRCEGEDAFDIKKLSIIDDGASDLNLLWGTCPGVVAPSGPGDALAFIVDGGDPDPDPEVGGKYVGPDLVVIHFTNDATFEVYDTNGSSDEADWIVVQSGQGFINEVGPDRGGPRSVGEMNIDAVQAEFPLQYQVAAVSLRDLEPGDIVPEPDMPPIAFPFSCDYFELRAARITAPGGLAEVARTARSLGARVTSVVGDSLLASPIDDHALAVLDARPGVDARRPAVFMATAVNDPEPTAWAIEQTRLDAAWDVVPRAPAVIAVLDQGVDGSRRDLAGRVSTGFNAFTNELFTPGTDSALGVHGTSVAGIIAGIRDNSTEIAGVNDGATILPVTVFDHANCADDVTIAAGLDWAISRDARIVNMSLGGPNPTATLENAVRRADNAGIVMIAATGNNEDVAPGEPNYPAAYPQVIGVGATGPTREGLATVADYSQSAGTDLVAPGGLNTGERDSDYAVLAEWEGIEYQAGTSFSAPFVAGLVSLWLSLHPDATADEARAALVAASSDLPGDRDGAGLVDALTLLGDSPPPDEAPPAAPTIDGDPATTHRLDSLDPVEAALLTSRSRYPDPASAPVVVLSRRDAFADALSGAPLTADGPLLLTSSSNLDRDVDEEITRVLADDGTIYILGGTAAISQDIELRLRADHPDQQIVRLRGANRFETSRAIVRETVARYGRAGQTLLARGFGPAGDPAGTAAWADAITAGAFAASRRVPLLIVPSANLGPTDLSVIDEITRPDGLVTLLGGTAALSADVLDAARTVRSARRVRGVDRDETAAAIAQTLWGVNQTGARTFVVLNTHGAQGWYLGLASAGYAADIGAPILSTRASIVPTSTATLMSRCGAAQVETWIAGTTVAVSGGVAAELDRLDGQAC